MIKSFNVNWDSYEEVAKFYNMFKSRMGDLNKNNNISKISRRAKNKLLFESCKNIFDTDISLIYSDLDLDQSDKFYVYAHLDPTKKIAIGKHGVTTFAATLGMEYFPFYIGKGCGDRFSIFERNEIYRKIKQKISSINNKEPIAIKIVENLSEKDSLILESKLIDIFGLIPYGGLLSNLDEGIKKEERRQMYKKHFNLLRQMNQIL